MYKHLTLNYVNYLAAPFFATAKRWLREPFSSRRYLGVAGGGFRGLETTIEFNRNLKQQNREDVIHRNCHLLEDLYSLTECSKIWTRVYATHFCHYWISI